VFGGTFRGGHSIPAGDSHSIPPCGRIRTEPPDFVFSTPVVATIPVLAKPKASDVPLLFGGVIRNGVYEVAPTDLVYNGIPSPTVSTKIGPATPPDLALCATAAVALNQPTQNNQPCLVSYMVRYIDGDPVDCTGVPLNTPRTSYPQCMCVPLDQRVTETTRDEERSGECISLTSSGSVRFEYCQPPVTFTYHLQDVRQALIDIDVPQGPTYTCEEYPLDAIVKDPLCQDIKSAHIRWSLSDSGKARLEPDSGYKTWFTALKPDGVDVIMDAGCGNTTRKAITIVEDPVGSVSLSPPGPHTLKKGDPALEISANIRSRRGTPLDCLKFTPTWDVSPPGVVTLQPVAGSTSWRPAADVTVTGYGTAEITATVETVKSQPPLTIRVPRPKEVRVSVNPSSVAVNGTAEVTGVVIDEDGNKMTGVPVQWSPSGGHLALVSSQADPPTATVKGVSVGEDKVVATVIDWPTAKGEATITVTGLTLTAISPGSTTDCQTASVTITGTGFRAGAQVGFDGPVSIMAGGVRVVNETTMTATTNSQMKQGTYDVRVTQGAETATLPRAFVVTACRSYTVAWTIQTSGGTHYTPTDPTYGTTSTSSNSMSFSGGVDISYNADGTRSVTPSSIAGSYTYRSREDTRVFHSCGGEQAKWGLDGDRWGTRNVTHSFVPTSGFLASLSSIGVSEIAAGSLSFSGLWLLNWNDTSMWQEHAAAGGDLCLGFSDYDRTDSGVSIFNANLDSCGPWYVAITLQGDGRVFQASLTRSQGDERSWFATSCRIMVTKN
jgi:hypothetical protein